MIDAETIPLEFWQDPQGDALLIYSARECSIYFLCWDDAGMPADYIGHLAFKGTSAVRSFPREFTPYRPTEHSDRSYILRVQDSDLARNYIDYRKRHYPQTRVEEKNHYVIQGHDIYHEILATSFIASPILKNQITDERLLYLIANE
jgi:hypothetical protein